MTINELHQLFLDSNGVCTDTRKLKNNQIFFALKGDNFDGNKYAEKAVLAGAKYAIIDNESINNPQCIYVKNVLNTLQGLANFHRNYLNIPILALTGSNGKTTTKELINVVLNENYTTTATKGNLNNHIGVPLTLLSMNTSTEIGIVEMGANHLKEIELLCKIAAPNYGYITNIGKAHLEGFGSEENILIGKTELFNSIKKNNGTVFCNLNDKKLMSKSENIKRITFSPNQNSNYTIETINNNQSFVSVKFNNTTINSNLIGNYNFTNIAASVAIGQYFNVPDQKIKKAIENYVPKINRSQLIEKENNSIILDAYNANPTSMQAALENFKSTITNLPKSVILGDMFELGKYSASEHQNIIDFFKKSNEFETVYFTGENFYDLKNNEFNKFKFFKNTTSLLEYLKETPLKNKHILIKGSRGMTLEKVVEFL